MDPPKQAEAPKPGDVPKEGTNALEEAMHKQEQEDDADLRALKEKLKAMSTQAPPPEKKDEMIKHLMSRLQQSEDAIRAAEEVITHERANRKRLNADVKKANNDLRELVEKEKKTLSDKVLAEVEKHLK